MGQDLLSNVALTGKPELVTDVNPLSEGELLRYYEAPESIRSFIGAPVFFSKPGAVPDAERPVAVIAVDSKVGDQFGQETLIQLGQFTKLLSALIKSYNEKYELLLSSELLRSMTKTFRSVFPTVALHPVKPPDAYGNVIVVATEGALPTR